MGRRHLLIIILVSLSTFLAQIQMKAMEESEESQCEVKKDSTSDLVGCDQTTGRDLVNANVIHEQRYPQLFDAFLSSTNEKELAIEILSFIFLQFKKIDPLYFAKGLKFYDIGCGDGRFSSLILKKLSIQTESMQRISYRGIDVQQRLVKLASRNLALEGIGSTKVYLGNFLEDPLPEVKLSSNFILASHVCYVASEMHDFIKKVQNIAQDDTICIFIHMPRSPLKSLRKTFNGILPKGIKNIVKKICNVLDRENIEYVSFNFKTSVVFPKLSEVEWQQLAETIEQSVYDKNYDNIYSNNLMLAKKLIEFFLNRPLETFTNKQKGDLLIAFRKLLSDENKLIIWNSMQIALFKPKDSNLKNQLKTIPKELEEALKDNKEIQFSHAMKDLKVLNAGSM